MGWALEKREEVPFVEDWKEQELHEQRQGGKVGSKMRWSQGKLENIYTPERGWLLEMPRRPPPPPQPPTPQLP